MSSQWSITPSSARIALAVLAIVPLVLYHAYSLLRWYRVEQLKAYPRLRPDSIWGHLKDVGEAMNGGKGREGQNDGMLVFS